DGVEYMAPVDGDFGGTWIATNDRGLTLTLLNGMPGPSSRSRGLLVLDLISHASVRTLADRIRELDLSPYAPFTLAALDPDQSAAVVEWDGTCRALAFRSERHSMLTSSSFDSGRVREKRREDYAKLAAEGCSADLLRSFHRNHGVAPSAYSVCMHRPDAQ